MLEDAVPSITDIKLLVVVTADSADESEVLIGPAMSVELPVGKGVEELVRNKESVVEGAIR
jgi:hypothetical protein